MKVGEKEKGKNKWGALGKNLLEKGPTPQRVWCTVTGPSPAGRFHSLGFC